MSQKETASRPESTSSSSLTVLSNSAFPFMDQNENSFVGNIIVGNTPGNTTNDTLEDLLEEKLPLEVRRLVLEETKNTPEFVHLKFFARPRAPLSRHDLVCEACVNEDSLGSMLCISKEFRKYAMETKDIAPSTSTTEGIAWAAKAIVDHPITFNAKLHNTSVEGLVKRFSEILDYSGLDSFSIPINGEDRYLPVRPLVDIAYLDGYAIAERQSQFGAWRNSKLKTVKLRQFANVMFKLEDIYTALKNAVPNANPMGMIERVAAIARIFGPIMYEGTWLRDLRILVGNAPDDFAKKFTGTNLVVLKNEPDEGAPTEDGIAAEEKSKTDFVHEQLRFLKENANQAHTMFLTTRSHIRNVDNDIYQIKQQIKQLLDDNEFHMGEALKGGSPQAQLFRIIQEADRNSFQNPGDQLPSNTELYLAKLNFLIKQYGAAKNPDPAVIRDLEIVKASMEALDSGLRNLETLRLRQVPYVYGVVPPKTWSFVRLPSTT